MNRTDQAANKARNQLLVMFVLLLVVDAALVITVQDWWAIGRILLTIVVMYFVIQGRKWAKWLLVGICSLLVVGLIVMVITLSSRLSITLVIGSLFMAILSAIITIFMVSNKDLHRYFCYKRQAYLP